MAIWSMVMVIFFVFVVRMVDTMIVLMLACIIFVVLENCISFVVRPVYSFFVVMVVCILYMVMVVLNIVVVILILFMMEITFIDVCHIDSALIWHSNRITQSTSNPVPPQHVIFHPLHSPRT